MIIHHPMHLRHLKLISVISGVTRHIISWMAIHWQMPPNSYASHYPICIMLYDYTSICLHLHCDIIAYTFTNLMVCGGNDSSVRPLIVSHLLDLTGLWMCHLAIILHVELWLHQQYNSLKHVAPPWTNCRHCHHIEVSAWTRIRLSFIHHSSVLLWHTEYDCIFNLVITIHPGIIDGVLWVVS